MANFWKAHDSVWPAHEGVREQGRGPNTPHAVEFELCQRVVWGAAEASETEE